MSKSAPSPFPGMDPYLEDPAFWPDFHSTFINYWREALADSLPDQYEARIDERLTLIERQSDEQRTIRPDVSIIHNPAVSVVSDATTGNIATLEPVIIPLLADEEERQAFIEILHRPDRSLVASLELLSPSNKAGSGRDDYAAKRRAILHSDAHLVELDLLLGGQRMPLARDYPLGDYFVLIARANRRPYCDVYPWSMRQQLPRIPVPLRHPDPDLQLDLAAVFATTYERGRYARSITYSLPPPIPATAEALRWIVEQSQQTETK